MTKEVQMARPLAPEDVRVDQFVCVMNVLQEHFPFWCLMEDTWKTPEPIRLTMMAPNAGTPLRVIEVCVPFVLVQRVDGTHCTLDLRRHRVASVSQRFGQRAFKRLRHKGAAKED